jgi:hypothetical protein
MAVAPSFNRSRKRPPAARDERPSPPSIAASRRPIDIVAPDRYCTTVLLDYAAPFFDAEIVPGKAWIVRLQPRTQTAWVLELLEMLERWLRYVRLPCATVRYGDRSYLIRTSTDLAQPTPAPESLRTPSTRPFVD